MKREQRSPSPPSGRRRGMYESWRPLNPESSPFAIPGLKFNNPLRNARTQKVLMSETPYLNPDDKPLDVATKNVTVAVRIVLFYRSIWAHPNIWDFVATDLCWPTAPDCNVLKKVVICHAMARQAYLGEERRNITKPLTFSPAVKACHSAIDAFNDAWFMDTTPRRRVSSDQVSNRRKEWSDIIRYNPVVLVSADFDPDSKDGRPATKRPDTPPPPVKKALSPGVLLAFPSQSKEKPTQLSPSKKRAASPDMMPPLSRKSPRLSNLTDVSSRRRNSSNGSVDPPTISRTVSTPISAEPRPAVPVRTSTAPAVPISNMSPARPRELKDGVAAMRMYIKLLAEQVDKVAAIDHTNTPDLVLCEIVEMQTLCQTIQNRDQRISSMLENHPY